MANLRNGSEHSEQLSSSRRKFFTWCGQIAAGVSIAGIGFLTEVPQALAKPDCYPCTGCTYESCNYDAGCYSQTLGTQPYFLSWSTLTGCVGRCTTIQHGYCVAQCHNPC